MRCRNEWMGVMPGAKHEGRVNVVFIRCCIVGTGRYGSLSIGYNEHWSVLPNSGDFLFPKYFNEM